MYDQGAQALSIQIQELVLAFFQKYFVQKLARWRWIVIQKLYNRWLWLLTMLLPWPDLHCAGPLGLWGFLQDLLANYR